LPSLYRTQRENAERAAERLREAVANHKIITEKEELSVTISVGVVMMQGRGKCDKRMKPCIRRKTRGEIALLWPNLPSCLLGIREDNDEKNNCCQPCGLFFSI